MKTYKSYEELKENTLKYYDEVYFKVKGKVFEYVILSSLFISFDTYRNDTIFKKLNIEDKYKFCSNSYGYETNHGIFPECHKNDYEALTRVALDLFKLCNNYKGDK